MLSRQVGLAALQPGLKLLNGLLLKLALLLEPTLWELLRGLLLKLLSWLLLKLLSRLLLELLSRLLLELLSWLLLELLSRLLLELLSRLLLELLGRLLLELLSWLLLKPVEVLLVLQERVRASGLRLSAVSAKSSACERRVDLSRLRLRRGLLDKLVLLWTGHAATPRIESRLLHHERARPLQAILAVDVLVLIILSLLLALLWESLSLVLELGLTRSLWGQWCQWNLARLRLGLFISIILQCLALLALLEQVTAPIFLEIGIVQVLLQRRRQSGGSVLDRGHMQFGSVFEVFGHTEIVDHVLGLVDKLDVDIQGPLGIVAGHLEVVLQEVDHTFVEFLEQGQKVVHQQAEGSQDYVVLDLVFHEAVLQKRINLLLQALQFPDQALIHRQRPQTAALLVGQVLESFVSHVIHVGLPEKLHPRVQVPRVSHDKANIAGTLVSGNVGVAQVEHSRRLVGQVVQCDVSIALPNHDVDHYQCLVHHRPGTVLEPVPKCSHDGVEVLLQHLVIHGSGHENGLDILRLGRRHLDFRGALDDFLVRSHGGRNTCRCLSCAQV